MAGDGLPEPAVSGKQLEELLHDRVMARVEDILAQQELKLWQRGQDEIAQLHQDRQQAATSLQELLERQESLVLEQAEMQRALSDISGKLDSVVKEMTEAVRSSGILPSWKATSSVPAGPDEGQFYEVPDATAQSQDDFPVDSGLQMSLPPLLPSSAPGLSVPDAAAIAVAAQMAAAAAAAAAAAGLLPENAALSAAVAALDASDASPQTPPRAVKGGAVLSLASALGDQQTPPPPGGPPSRLNIAACLDAEGYGKPAVPLLQLRAEAPEFVPSSVTTEAR
eukprot:TRINITY_DN59569_c0_g1_i1.p1 TRINITY_DN59569_c0_g1~~TRINITY_DN59569_c0_g1_i1.p1  ORF type:complete len:281 (-),score=81.80 TRINITY_DN59569_c0_g1_i1:573-1415(-)